MTTKAKVEEKLNVYQCINAVQKDLLTGISKDNQNKMQGYAFRGIDNIYNALSPSLSKHGLVILPSVFDRSVVERQTKNGGALFYTTVKVNYHFVSAHDGSSHVVTAYGEAMDSGDKSTNKAMSAAYKYACFQSFCIPTENVDADSETHEVVTKTIEEKITDCANSNDLRNLWLGMNKKEQDANKELFSAAKTRLAA